MEVPYLSYDQLKTEAARVRSQSKYANQFPVAIEIIVERDYEMDVVPIRGLQTAFNIDAFISQDMQTISVDEFVLENRLNRYRFTLAHELGHRVLHSDILQTMKFDSIDDWKSQLTEFPEREYGFLEYQANTFANCLLVPADELDRRFVQAIDQIKTAGLNPADYPNECLDSIATGLGKQFEVSRDAILNRLTNKQEDFESRLR
ncbi:ImmA/IrrE family metallo-endopeptidase [Rhodopirellula sp. P2]|uniref:ImmA/IrrE family metallo-endopeptidase n=1 Tax=Rhodopirellula sp. P2 TaxID=2127060 RepID=UPI0023687E8B|nr:ImmA/IrrE family metallo-endopeptidase [Rhodopirellula sp. P2]WDQ16803.1 ImmA/IrrE family metallo-endopeptidase [Rhodopirellula sp. P2]